MNLALGSIILFLVLLPGIVFRSSYLSSSFSRKVIDKNPIDDIFFAILPAVFFHFLGIVIINSREVGVCGSKVNLEFLMQLSTSSVKGDFSPISEFPLEIFLYNLSVILISLLFGHLIREAIRYSKLDRKTRLFRFTNKWHYVFSGELLDFPNIPDESSDVDIIMLDVLSDVSGKSVIYSGQYLDHSLTKDGDLENIIIKFPSKKDFDSDNEIVEISSRFFLIPYQTIKNLNIRYFSIEETSEHDSDEDSSILEIDVTPID